LVQQPARREVILSASERKVRGGLVQCPRFPLQDGGKASAAAAGSCGVAVCNETRAAVSPANVRANSSFYSSEPEVSMIPAVCSRRAIASVASRVASPVAPVCQASTA
jgi:hypothetical protein